MNEHPTGVLYYTRCDRCAVHNRSICGSSSQAAQELEKISRIRHFSPGQTIVAEYSESGFVGNVVRGVVKLQRTLEDGRQQVVGLLFPSDFFGHPFRDTTSFSFEAASDVELCVFDRKAFEAILQRHPEVEHEILIKALTELDAAREWMVLLGCQSARERVASFLLMLLRRAKTAGCGQADKTSPRMIRFPIKRKDIALFLGTTLETISRQIQWMVRRGILHGVDANTFEVLNPGELARVAAHEEWLWEHDVP